MRFGSLLGGIALSASIASSAIATTYIVDVNGTGQFTNIPPAIAAAQDGDVIIVLPGNYSSFMLTKSLTIVGLSNATLVAPSTIGISSIPAGNRAAVVNLRAAALSVANCAGHVIVQEVSAPAGQTLTLGVTQSADVRLRNLTVQQTTSPAGSRIEVARCFIQGPNGVNGAGADGQPGIDSSGGNLLHLVHSYVTGGHGGDSLDHVCTWGGNGAEALQTTSTDTVIMAGGLLRGGDGGGATSCFAGYPCFYDGYGASAAWLAAGSTFRYSDTTTFQGGISWDAASCAALASPWFAGSGTIVQAVPEDPTLDLTGTPTAGSAVQFVVQAPPGSVARLYFGRAPILVADGLAVVERLAPYARVVNLGTVPASGQVTLSWTIPAVPRGTFLVAQAEVVLQGGELRRTNSVPVVVR